MQYFSIFNGISIHAPTRGATGLVNKVERMKRISIHAPTRGATLLRYDLRYLLLISIHAPTRGATWNMSMH